MIFLKFRLFILLSLLFSLVLFTSAAYATYIDYGIVDVITPQSIDSNTYLDINIIVSNNSSLPADINLYIDVISPDGNIDSFVEENVIIPANDINNFISPIPSVFSSSPHPYKLVVTIDGTDSYPSNDTFTRYFTVKKVSTKIPVPEMPVYFGFFIALLVVFFIGNDKLRKQKNKK